MVIGKTLEGKSKVGVGVGGGRGRIPAVLFNSSGLKASRSTWKPLFSHLQNGTVLSSQVEDEVILRTLCKL